MKEKITIIKEVKKRIAKYYIVNKEDTFSEEMQETNIET